MKCIVCGRETEGSVSRTGTIWPMVCPECMEHENRVVEASLLGMAKVVTDLIHPSPDDSQDAYIGLDEIETALLYQPRQRGDN